MYYELVDVYGLSVIEIKLERERERLRDQLSRKKFKFVLTISLCPYMSRHY